MIATQDRLLIGAAAGWQLPIMGTNLSVLGAVTKQDLDGNIAATKPLQGVTMLAGTYYYFLNTPGCTYLDVTLTLGSGTAPTITLYPTLSDTITAKGAVTAVATVTAVQATTSLTTLKGERGCILKLVAAATFVLSVADYSAL